ncbi:MAG: bifunctional glutamate N-acetyltransferase/amino-acid acetyltransferase ArgJ [Fibrobacter sp.]|nr:bifunctional glutamate N-acetyltransferase/amino-acid acetyltransferase ArgJ [Fibrobacter sp.]
MKQEKTPASFRVISGGVTKAAGFKAGGVKAGIKVTGKKDLALLFSEKPCSAAGTFTTNAIRASSVDWCSDLLPSSGIRAIFCNSGCANACTGKRGKEDTEKMATIAAEALGVKKEAVLVASTGVIGKFLPLEKMKAALPSLSGSLSVKNGKEFSTAIMTTDLVKKESAVEAAIGGKQFVIGGCCKGSGMIHPNMATMLAFITTDAAISPARLNKIAKRVVDMTFNNLTVDGDTSTNDMVLVLANGASGVKIESAAALDIFQNALFTVCNDLCKKIAADGEGATKRVEIRVSGAVTEKDAKKAAKAVATSNLTKCALFGNDPNWGRISCAVGYSGAAFSKEKMTILLCGVPVFKNLQPVPFNEKKLHTLLKKKVVEIDIDLGKGKASAIAHTCDFSYDYVKINAEYHT